MNFIELPENTPGAIPPFGTIHIAVTRIASVTFLTANTARVQFFPTPVPTGGVGAAPITVTEQPILLRLRQMVEDRTREWLRSEAFNPEGETFIPLDKVDRVLFRNQNLAQAAITSLVSIAVTSPSSINRLRELVET